MLLAWIQPGNSLSLAILGLGGFLLAAFVLHARRTERGLRERQRLAEKLNQDLAKQRLQLQEKQSRLVALNRDLMGKNDALMRRNEEVQAFYQVVSHELRTPLTSALGFIGILLRGKGGELTETQTNYLQIVEESCEAINKHLEDLLDAARIETGKLKVELIPTSLNNIIDGVLAMERGRVVESNLKVVRDLADTPLVMADSRRIRQVLINLIDNAIKFTPPGGRLVVKTTEVDDDFVQVTVSDNGVGIEEGELGRLFDRLYQVEEGQFSGHGGLGIGLNLVKAIIELHGGTVNVESKPGSGTAFSVTLKKAPEGSFELDEIESTLTREWLSEASWVANE